MEHRHADLHGQSLVKAAEAALTNAGQQWTPMRSKVLAALCELQRPSSAYEIADLISKSEGRRVPTNSVYRILDVFVETNLVRRVESTNAYVANSHPSCKHDCIFLICDFCGDVTHLDDDRVARSFRNAAKFKGFQPERPVIEMHGRCARCG